MGIEVEIEEIKGSLKRLELGIDYLVSLSRKHSQANEIYPPETRDEFKTRIVKYVGELEDQDDQKQVLLRNVVGAFNRSSTKFGGMTQLMQELVAEQRLQVAYTASNCKVVTSLDRQEQLRSEDLILSGDTREREILALMNNGPISRTRYGAEVELKRRLMAEYEAKLGFNLPK